MRFLLVFFLFICCSINGDMVQVKDKLLTPHEILATEAANQVVLEDYSRSGIDYRFDTLKYYNDQKDWMKNFQYNLTENNDNKPTTIYNNKTYQLKNKRAVVRAYSKIFQIGRRKDSVKNAIAKLVKTQKQEGLIAWAIPYQFKPEGQTMHLNIEFDHIPPGSATPKDDEKFKATFKEEAPTLAISNFDHRSTLWKMCSTTGGDQPIMKKYKEFVERRNYTCAIFTNLYCIKDRENKTIDIKDRVSPTLAFDRYKEGFKSLVNLHYDFGSAFNPLLQKPEELISSAYCEVTNKTTGCNTDATGVTENIQIVLMSNKEHYYCSNYLGCSNTCGDSCKYQERNLRIDQYNLLQDWLNGNITDHMLLGKCGLTEDEWKNLFQ